MKKFVIGALALCLAGCNSPRKCIDGRVYEDTQGDGVFTEVWIPLTAESIACADEEPAIRTTAQQEPLP
jgi:hypothetical protein